MNMLSLWCAGKLGNCPPIAKTRFRFTCLYCRWRRRVYGKYTTPTYYIRYTYTSINIKVTRNRFVKHGYVYTRRDGGLLTYREWQTLTIDPRGRFTRWRCAAIIVLDKIMLKTKVHKPLLEFCELLANYP